MDRCAPPSPRSPLLLAVAVGSLATLSAALVPTTTATAAVSIDAPASPSAGLVELSGSAASGPGETTTVVYVVDATRSTGQVTGLDCSGNGVAGAEDDLNADGRVGDVLDCEISGVHALNRSLATTSGLQAGLIAFSDQAAAADLDPAGSATFLPPAYAGGDARPRIESVASSVQANRIGLYDTKDLGGSGSGTAFSSAVSTAMDVLRQAPPGPKWVMFLSDGLSGIDDGLLASLGGSGIRLRSFAIGSEATCARSGSLHKMAAATGESCAVVGRPSELAVALADSQPDTVSGVTVAIGDVAVAATVNAVGGWRAGFVLGAGTHTARVSAVLASGAVQSAHRTFTVAAAAPGADGPADGTFAPGPGTLRATVVQVARPEPSRTALPPRVTGRVGRPLDRLDPDTRLAGSRVVLEAREADGAPWTAVAKDRVDGEGRFVLTWKPKAGRSQLRVALEPTTGFAASTAVVPEPPISACKVVKRGGGWTVTCRTTVKQGQVVRLLDGHTVQDRSRVRGGSFRLTGRGRVWGHRVDLKVGGRRVHLDL